MEHDKITIIPEPPGLWPLELVIADQLDREINGQKDEIFEHLEIEQAYRG